jgi:hypothetical protein
MRPSRRAVIFVTAAGALLAPVAIAASAYTATALASPARNMGQTVSAAGTHTIPAGAPRVRGETSAPQTRRGREAVPDTVYVVDFSPIPRGTVTPIRTATNTAGRPIRVGRSPTRSRSRRTGRRHTSSTAGDR